MLTAEQARAVVDYDPETGVFRDKLSGEIRGNSGWPYVHVRLYGRVFLAHRLAWLMTYGYWPKVVDHRDGNPRNNALNNLRECTHAQNRVNAPAQKHSKSKVRGVHWHSGAKKYRVQIQKDGKSYHGGFFADLEEASRAAADLSRRVHGEFACTDRVPRKTIREMQRSQREGAA